MGHQYKLILAAAAVALALLAFLSADDAVPSADLEGAGRSARRRSLFVAKFQDPKTVAPRAGAGPWTEEEHERFLRGLAHFGAPGRKTWNAIARVYVRTRSGEEVQEHWREYAANRHDPDYVPYGPGADTAIIDPKSGVTCRRSCTKTVDLPSSWCLDAEGVPRYVGGDAGFETTADVTRYNHDGFVQCLAQKTIVFMGDSRVRYQYMDLVHFLVEGRFMRCQDSGVAPEEDCSLIDHTEWWLKLKGDGWNDWYRESTAAFQREPYAESLCDCWRPDPFDPDRTYENRFVRLSGGGPEEINLIMLQNFRDRVRMNEAYPPFSTFVSTEGRCRAGECGDVNRTNAFDGDTRAALWEVLPRLGATHAFVNLGWESWHPFWEQAEFSCEMEAFARAHPETKLYLLSHPPTNLADQKFVASNRKSFFRTGELKCDVDVLDRTLMSQGVPLSWYWDKQHALSILNEEYNHQLVEKICPLL